MKTMDKLRECPFCKGKLEITEMIGGVTGFHCETCGAVISFRGSEGPRKAVKAVNLRPEPENKPLTLEQLRERVNSPVYLVTKEWSGWVLLFQLWDDRFNFIHPDWHNSSWHKQEYAKECEYGWLAYDRPPKEAT